MPRSKKPVKNPAPPPSQHNSSLVSAQWEGPLPPPSTLKAFNEIIENGAERIMRMAEAEQAHRHEIDKLLVQSDSASVFRGQVLGFLVSALSIGGAVWTALSGAHWAVSVALVGVPLASIVRAFLNSKPPSGKDD